MDSEIVRLRFLPPHGHDKKCHARAGFFVPFPLFSYSSKSRLNPAAFGFVLFFLLLEFFLWLAPAFPTDFLQIVCAHHLIPLKKTTDSNSASVFFLYSFFACQRSLFAISFYPYALRRFFFPFFDTSSNSRFTPRFPYNLSFPRFLFISTPVGPRSRLRKIFILLLNAL